MLLAGVAHGGTHHYYYTDPQGTVLAKADAQGNIIASYDYAPYGAQALGTAPSGPGYTGHVNDPDTGLAYMQARYYDPMVGRFISTDPVGPGAGDVFTFNRFAYVNNNPVMGVDPTGRYICGSNGLSGCYVADQWVRNMGIVVSSEKNSKHGKDNASGKSEASLAKAVTLAPVTVTANAAAKSVAEFVGSRAAWAGGLVTLGGALFLADGNSFHDMIYGYQCCYGEIPLIVHNEKSKDVPDRGPPGEWVNGKRRSRLYNPDGTPKVDIDNPHPGMPKTHVHDWTNGVREHPGREVPDESDSESGGQ